MPKTPVRYIAYVFMIIILLAGTISAAAAHPLVTAFVDHTPNQLQAKQLVTSEPTAPQVIIPDPMVQMIIDQVTTDDIYDYLRGFAGEQPVWVDGAWFTIDSRHSMSASFLKAAHYLGEQYAENGLDVEYHIWNGSHGPNVIGELPGLVNPDEIYIIGGHLDDVGANPSAGAGADDNASGSVAGLIAADILSQYQWGCTLRFVGWSGEEEGLLGSAAYAQRSDNLNENILGYLNLDMIAWNTIGSDPHIYLTYNPSMPQTLVFAQLFAEVVDAYNIDLIPQLGTNYGGSSDQASFWDHGYNSILGIEGSNDFNPYYHGPNDTTANTDPTYYTNYVKAALATFMHLNNCLIPSGIGSLDGHVTDSSNSAPLEGVNVDIQDTAGHNFTVMTDLTGYYTETLLSGTYTVTANLYGYYPQTVTGVQVITDTVSTQDFALDPKPVYTVSGYVRDASTNAPLAATVEFTDAPVAPVATDPSTGYYSIQVAEGTWTMRAIADNHSPATATVDVTGNVSQDFNLFPICDALSDDVEDGNIGWTAQAPWGITTEASHSPTHSWTDSPGGQYSSGRNISLTSPALDLSAYTGLSLSFWHIYDTEPGYDYGYVEYSTNGGSTWETAASYDGYDQTTWTNVELPLEALDNQSNVKIRFRFQSDGSLTADGWHIDDIALTGGGPACIPASAPTAEFSSNSPVLIGQPLTFINETTGTEPIAYEWDFGDGSGTSTDTNPVYTYAEVGDYTVTLTATNSQGSSTVQHSVLVMPYRYFIPIIFKDPAGN